MLVDKIHFHQNPYETGPVPQDNQYASAYLEPTGGCQTVPQTTIYTEQYNGYQMM